MLSAMADKGLTPYLMALRPHQWSKSLVVFAAPLFSFQFSHVIFLNSFLAFTLFCATSSGFYLINDSFDVKSDRRHPVKCKRPIAAGLVSIPEALLLAALLLIIAVVFGWRHAHLLGATLVAYALLQVAYNLKLKQTVILDIVAIATGFVLRACAGAAATGITLSTWFLVCTAMLALFLGVEKRKAELRLGQIQGTNTRKVLNRYSLPLLNRIESTVTTGAVMSYALWSAGPVLQGAPTPWMMITLPFVLYGIFRYQLLSDPSEVARQSHGPSYGGRGERPEEILLTDRPMALVVVVWAIAVVVILFLHKQGLLP